MSKQETKKTAKVFKKTIAFDSLPIAKMGDPVTAQYKDAIAKLSKEDQAKYVG